uniref:DCC-interacting protein 13-alpha-like n=1 Tax=Sinocyclocheilus anshuiensis TaxID=1608454 RepID=A0A671RAK1_9TELE
MPGIDKLPLEETLEDSPQTRSLLGVFEEDTAATSSYFSQLFKAMQRIYDAQNELSAATHLTSRLLKDYEKQRFPLGGDDEVMSSTLQQFAKVIDELSSCHAVLSTQLADAMMFPITQFQERDLREIVILKEVFQISSDDHDTAVNRYSRLSKRKENEKVKNEVMEDVYTSRKKQHETIMHYFASLNMLQYKKKIALLEPLLGYMQAQISFFKLGSENLTQQWEEFLTNIGTSVQNVRREMDSDAEATEQTIQDLKAASDPLYMPDPDPNKIPVNRNLTRKAGYLNTRYKTGLVSSAWERQYFFTQGGNLMSQSRGDVAGGLVMDIDNCSVMAVDCDDRRFCFQITSFDGKKIYLSENPEEIAARVNQSALEAVTPSPSFQQRHESFRPIIHTTPVHQLMSLQFFQVSICCVVPQFPLSSVVLCASHQENKRLFGFVLKTAGGRVDGRPVTVCYVFESNNDGEKICDSVGLAKQIALHSEMDLEEQSRLIAASSRPGQPAADGQFLVLSNSQSEDSDAGEEGQKTGESEA